MPAGLTVIVRKTDEGFYAKVKELPNCYTQAATVAALVEMINDAIFTHFDVPENYRGRLGLMYLPEVKKPGFADLRKKMQEACRELLINDSESSLVYKYNITRMLA
mgnify:FL=1